MGDGRVLPTVRRGWAGLLDLVYPPHCVACGRMGAWLCAACLEGYPAFRPPWCLRCGRPLARGRVCPACRRARESAAPSLDALRSVGPHAGALRAAVHALKYEGVRVLAAPLAALMADTYALASPAVDVVIPVPLHPRRIRRRGYNQAVLLAQGVAERLDLPLAEDWLRRERDTASQVGLTRTERWTNVHGAFRVVASADAAALAGRRVLLVDDVCTSGATLRAAAGTLRQAGATAVAALTLTRAPIGADGRDCDAVRPAAR